MKTGLGENDEDVPLSLQDSESAAASLLQYAEDEAVRSDEDNDLEEDLDALEVESDSHREKWNSPRINAFRYCGVNLSFFVMGMHDGCIGVRMKPGCLEALSSFHTFFPHFTLLYLALRIYMLIERVNLLEF